MPSTCEPSSKSDNGSHELSGEKELEEGGLLLGGKSALPGFIIAQLEK
jgi:hypothetical protein